MKEEIGLNDLTAKELNDAFIASYREECVGIVDSLTLGLDYADRHWVRATRGLETLILPLNQFEAKSPDYGFEKIEEVCPACNFHELWIMMQDSIKVDGVEYVKTLNAHSVGYFSNGNVAVVNGVDLSVKKEWDMRIVIVTAKLCIKLLNAGLWSTKFKSYA